VVEGTTLERWHTRKGIEGSNPSLSVTAELKKCKRDSDERKQESTRSDKLSSPQRHKGHKGSLSP
jgi:hypothetical protein